MPIPAPLRWLFRGLDLVSPRLAGKLAAPLFLSTRRHRVPEREKRVLASAERHELATERGPAVAWVWSRPCPDDTPVPTVFLIHGWEGRGAQLGAFVDPLRRSGHRVVAVDAPGHGEAPGSSSSLVAMGAALEAATRRWGPAQGLVSHSAGAAGTTWALGRGLAPERAVYVAPGADLAGYTRLFAGALGLGMRAVDALIETIETRLGIAYREIEPAGRAPEMTVPLLVITDREDREAPLASVRRLVNAWPGARLRVVEGLGHRRILRDPDVVDEAVAFLIGDDDRVERLRRAARDADAATTGATAPPPDSASSSTGLEVAS